MKEKLERFEGGASVKGPALSGASLGAQRISNLQQQLQTVRQEDNDMRRELDDAKHENVQLKARMKTLEYENEQALQRASVAMSE